METRQQQEEEFSLLGLSPLPVITNCSGFAAFDVGPSTGFSYEFDTFSLFPIDNIARSSISYPWDVDQAMPPPLPPAPQVSGGGVAAVEEVKRKRSHSESEKMRRMRLKSLFASLSSVLPDADKSKKVGAPSTVDRVMEYIPQLRKEVEELTQTKQQLAPTTLVTTKNEVLFPQAPAAWTRANASSSSSSSTSNTTCSSSVGAEFFSTWSVQVNEIGNGEFSIQISTSKFLINTFIPISEVLRMLEEEYSLIIIGVSCSDSSAGRVFYNVHLMEEDPDTTQNIECELLRQKLLSSCQKWEEMCLWMITQGT